MIRAKINGKLCSVAANTTILTAAKALGISIPTLCYHPKFPPGSTCRLCIVHREQDHKLVPACSTVIGDGESFVTSNPSIESFRKTNLEFLFARHPKDCLLCEVTDTCRLKHYGNEYNIKEWSKHIRGENSSHRIHDFDPCISRDLSKCIDCGLCVKACGSTGQNLNCIGFVDRGDHMLPVTAFDKPLGQTNCIDCGQCTSVCPTGALTERSDWRRVLTELSARKKTLVVQTAPATRVAIGEEFGLEPGSISTGKMVYALRQLGFDYVFDTNFSADVTIMEEGTEFLQRLSGKGGPLPMFTSCCPAWINYLEKIRPDLLPHLSTTKSPQQIHGALTKHIYGPNVFLVSIMPCTAKKGEAVRPFMKGDVDAVITTRELARMIRARELPFASFPEEGELCKFDSPLGESSGTAALFGATGGVLESALRTAFFLIGKELPSHRLEFHQIRGLEQIKECHIEGVGTVAVANGIAAAQALLANDEWKTKYKMIEVMSCPGGCLGGGGEPKSLDPQILQKRMNSIYRIDKTSKIRCSHENQEVKQLYEKYLDHPLSHLSEALLHTSYYPRHSERELLAKFLSEVNHRQGELAAELFEPNGEWHTNDERFGIVRGRAAIQQFIDKVLPKEGPKHQLADAATGLEVEVNGQRFEFRLEKGSSGLIERLERIVGDGLRPQHG